MTLWRDSLIQPVSQRRKEEGKEKNVNTRKEGGGKSQRRKGAPTGREGMREGLWSPEQRGRLEPVRSPWNILAQLCMPMEAAQPVPTWQPLTRSNLLQ